jgi:2-polyprenyl-3-methyl-5-hydroxy-6-metoxy-1,4-benzoquinol methylase
MGADDDGFPLAAIFKTRYGRCLSPGLSGTERPSDHDTDPPQSITGLDDLDAQPMDLDDVTPLPEEYQYEEVDTGIVGDLVEAIGRFAPVDADPRVIGEVVRSVAGMNAEMDDSEFAWYRTAFTADSFLTRPPKPGRGVQVEAHFVAKTLGLTSGSRLLDVGCGFGRLTNALSADGYEAVGLDLSEDMLTRAQLNARGLGVQPEYVWGDMRRLDYDSEFDALISMDTSFGYFSDAENLLTLTRMARAVRPGGRVLIDVLSRERALTETPGRSWWEGKGCLIQEDTDYDQVGSRLNIKRLTVFADGRQLESLISIRLYTAHELIEMCRLVGLQLVEVSGSPHERGAYFGASSRRLAVTVQRVA